MCLMTDDDVLNALPITENIQLPSKGTLIILKPFCFASTFNCFNSAIRFSGKLLRSKSEPNSISASVLDGDNDLRNDSGIAIGKLEATKSLNLPLLIYYVLIFRQTSGTTR